VLGRHAPRPDGAPAHADPIAVDPPGRPPADRVRGLPGHACGEETSGPHHSRPVLLRLIAGRRGDVLVAGADPRYPAPRRLRGRLPGNHRRSVRWAAPATALRAHTQPERRPPGPPAPDEPRRRQLDATSGRARPPRRPDSLRGHRCLVAGRAGLVVDPGEPWGPGAIR